MEQDLLEQWISERAFVQIEEEKAKYFEMKAGEAFKDFKDWCAESNYKPLGRQRFSQRMAKKFKKIERKNGNFFVGLCFKKKETELCFKMSL